MWLRGRTEAETGGSCQKSDPDLQTLQISNSPLPVHKNFDCHHQESFLASQVVERASLAERRANALAGDPSLAFLFNN